jgi:hypothetical protein
MKKSKLDKVHQFLIDQPKARERKSRYPAIRWFIINESPWLKDKILTNEELEMVIKRAITVNRYINRLQQLDESLQGSDYKDKKILQDETKIDLEYSPCHKNDIKTLSTLEDNQ